MFIRSIASQRNNVLQSDEKSVLTIYISAWRLQHRTVQQNFNKKKCLVKCCFRLHWSTQYGELLLFQLFVNRRENTRSCFFRVPSPSTDTTDFEMKISHFTWGFLKRGMCSSPCNSLSQCEIKYTTCVGVFCVCPCLHCICLFLYTGLPWKRDHDLNES